MKDPYEVLGLDAGASDKQIRSQYLKLVRRHTPDRDPQRFAEIREAYELLKDPLNRLKTRLFDMRTNENMDAIYREVKQRLRTARLPAEVLLSLADK